MLSEQISSEKLSLLNSDSDKFPTFYAVQKKVFKCFKPNIITLKTMESTIQAQRLYKYRLQSTEFASQTNYRNSKQPIFIHIYFTSSCPFSSMVIW